MSAFTYIICMHIKDNSFQTFFYQKNIIVFNIFSTVNKVTRYEFRNTTTFAWNNIFHSLIYNLFSQNLEIIIHYFKMYT